ncbi:MAG: DUF222 domain-containing protein, partial [Frankiales bacterium]|nr:DUF222 domain-containing protein [Frankiales bacterium]
MTRPDVRRPWTASPVHSLWMMMRRNPLGLLGIGGCDCRRSQVAFPHSSETPATRGRCPMTAVDDRDTALGFRPVELGFHPDWDVHDPIAWLTGDPSALLPLLQQPVDATDLILLEQVDVEAITEPAELIDYLSVVGRLEARLASLRLAAEAAFANTACPDPTVRSSYAEAAAEQEVAYATRNSAYGASKEIERALALKETFPSFRAALAAGEITERHCAALVDQTRYITDTDVLATIEAAALEKARTLTASELRKHLDKLIARHD